jgi:hypothetical protein
MDDDDANYLKRFDIIVLSRSEPIVQQKEFYLFVFFNLAILLPPLVHSLKMSAVGG